MITKNYPTRKGANYEVFARDNPERPLQHIGTVQAENEQLAIAHARFVYSERPWAELTIAPSDGFLDCLRSGKRGVIGIA